MSTGEVRRRMVLSRFPEFARLMRIAISQRRGIPESEYPIALRRALFLAHRSRPTTPR